MLLRKLGIGLAFLGLIDSIYLATIKVTESPYLCGISSCEKVNNSTYAYLLGIPVSVWGIAFYLLILCLIILKMYRLLLIGSLIGLIFATHLTWVEAFILQVWCLWCVLSAWIVFCLVVVSWRLRSGNHGIRNKFQKVLNGRGGGTRTHDLTNPNRTR